MENIPSVTESSPERPSRAELAQIIGEIPLRNSIENFDFEASRSVRWDVRDQKGRLWDVFTDPANEGKYVKVQVG